MSPRAEHTPTPWIVDQYNGRILSASHVIARAPVDPPLAPAYVTGETPHATWSAALDGLETAVRAVNAHADLVAALEVTLRALESHLDESCRDHGLGHRDQLCPCNQNEVQQARAALAKAKAKGEAS